jgi:RND family efflux transporter MFP subunit
MVQAGQFLMARPYLVSHWSLSCLLSVALAGLFLAGCKKKEEGKIPPPIVLTQIVGQENVPVIKDFVGTLQGLSNASIQAQVAGYILAQDYKEGSFVKKGDVLFEIDPQNYQAAVAQAQGNLDKAIADQQDTASNARRAIELLPQNAISQREYDQATAANAQALAQIETCKATLLNAQINLGYCRITSPIDGVAGKAQCQIGDLVGPGTGTTLTTVSTLNPIRAEFVIAEQEYLAAYTEIDEAMKRPIGERHKVLQLILANGDTFPQPGVFEFVDRQVDISTGAIRVYSQFPNPDNMLRPGQFARVRIPMSILENAVVIPQKAVMEVQGTYQVVVVGAGDKAEIRTVVVGPRTGTNWVITSGLKEGETIVIDGVQKAKQGEPLTAKPAPITAPPSKDGAPVNTPE